MNHNQTLLYFITFLGGLLMLAKNLNHGKPLFDLFIQCLVANGSGISGNLRLHGNQVRLAGQSRP